MPNPDTILLLKGQIRSDLKSVIYSNEVGKYQVVFSNGKRFYYNPENVEYLSKGDDLLMPVRVTKVADGVVFQKVIGVTQFISEKTKVVKAYRVVFENGNHRDYPATDLLVEKHLKGERAKNVYNYLKELSNFSKISVDEDRTIGLSQKYAKVKMISEISPFADYLVGNESRNGRSILLGKKDSQTIIFPFGCNRSQYQAVRQALCNKISVIQGPPGTGKTQTILNIVANLIIAGKSVEIVSNNNSAVLNVAEKMAKGKYALIWLVAYLGKSANKKTFYEEQTGFYPDLSGWKKDDLDVIESTVNYLSSHLQNGYENLEKLAELRERLRQAETQYKHVNFQDSVAEPLKKVKTSDEALKLMDLISIKLERKGNIGFFTRIKLRRKGIKDISEAISSLERTYYIRTVNELKSKIAFIETDVEAIAENETKLEDLSLKYLHGKLYKMYGRKGEKRPVFKQVDVETYDPQPFLDEYPIVLSTTFSATTNICQGYAFDYMIMDEASQVDISAGALAMNSSRNAVIVGDDRQLPNVVTSDEKIAADMLFKKYDIPSSYDFTTNSFLSSLCSLYPSIPKTMLREHYRCAPEIIGFCNKQFYGGSLIAMTKETDAASMKICMTVEGNLARGAINTRQADMIAREILPEVLKEYRDVGIIAPYNEQVRTIGSAVIAAGYSDIPVATVHKFQGRENDVIILSTVDNQIRSFVDDPHLLNVAVSRAKKLFILVVSGNEQPASNVKDLIDYISYYNGDVHHSSISSVFDLLYAQMTERRKAYLAGHRRISQYDSENLISSILDDILKTDKYRRLGVLHNYPLRSLVPFDAPLNEEEMAFAQHPWSHLDFLIYDKVSLSPVLAIEVDGTSFHFKGSDQYNRDRIKDSVLAKLGLPLLRLSTDGSSEREKIVEGLEEIV